MSFYQGTRTSSLCTNWRVRLLVFLFAAAGLLLCVRLVHVQWLGSQPFAEKANRQRIFTEKIPARPGEILDRQGRLLASTITSRSLFVVPEKIENPADVARSIAGALELNPEELCEQIERRRDKKFLWIKRRLTEGEVAAVRALNLPERAWGFREEYLRKYPQGVLAAHVIGLRDVDGVGRGGLEQSLDAQLRGEDGSRMVVRDARGRVIDVLDEVTKPPQPGETAVLTLDVVVQLFVERELEQVMEEWKPSAACAIVMDPRTGDIIAMASRPTFDPNNPVNVPDAAWKNTAIASMYEPGSTFKPFIVSAAIDKGVLDPHESFDCEHGSYKMGSRVLHDEHHYGELSVTDILVKSSNIGMAKIGERLKNEGLYQAAITFGFGRPTGSELPGELGGMLHPLRNWTSYSTGSVPMGQEIAVTPLQMIVAHCALANSGVLRSPRLVLREADLSPLSSDVAAPGAPSTSLVTRTVSADAADWVVREPMVEVVKRGTGKKAQLDGYLVFGKTGTAQKMDPKTGKYSTDKHVSSFLCGAPAEDPRALVLVVVDEPSVGGTHYGGTIAAPAAASILQQTLVYLRVPSKDVPLRSAERGAENDSE
ncbi:MAG: peptidoglycan D,D-transpeptidase FtsI family protein [Planctomycetaceae bacterium]